MTDTAVKGLEEDLGDLHMMEQAVELHPDGDSPHPQRNVPTVTDPAMLQAIADGRKAYCEYLNRYTCYHLIPQSSKMIVFDTNLLVKKAFFALLQNGIRSAPVWDHKTQQFVGIVTITDFINILRKYYKSPGARMDELEEHKIQTWRDSLHLSSSLVRIDPKDTLLTAVTMLLDQRIHRLPVIDSKTGNALFIVTHKRILSWVTEHFANAVDLKFLDYTLEELGIGTHQDIATVRADTPLIQVLNLFVERRVSALPIVDENDKVINVYAKFDVINLARERAYTNLDIPVKEALAHRAKGFESVITCRDTDTLRTVIDQIVRARVHRLIVVDDMGRVSGVVSLSDVLQYLIKG
eukprot:comp21280_c0_seq1/m.29044 comp21280_c0_seq1/g.29044  ORF comp21280_c0_seq1/g.29044 comp21280_c0_seq1/m.29044 type:complete len:352 (-) comp21280_c0_seq1:83-1138(-)